MRWLLTLVPLLGCGVMCFGVAIAAAVGFGRASHKRVSSTTSVDERSAVRL